MLLLEHEAKTLLQQGGLPVPQSTLIRHTSDAAPLATPVVLKSQVPVGGRGKLGGVKIIKDQNTLAATINHLFALPIKGFTPSSILAEELVAIKKEFYISLLIDRDSASVRLMAHTSGGVEVESNDSKDFFDTPITQATLPQQAAKLADYLDLNKKMLADFTTKIHSAFIKNDATLIEINPLILTADNALLCGDCKMELDDAAQFRHPDWSFEQKQHDTNFVVLDTNGTVATIANGAGLAMATVDAVAANSMKPANFLDIGGGASTQSVLEAFRQIKEFSSVRAIIINIFAGITRCDEVARAIIAAKQQLPDLPPLFIRLAGTNYQEAAMLLRARNISTLATLEECLAKAKEVVDA